MVDIVNGCFSSNNFDLESDLLAKELTLWGLESQVNGMDGIYVASDSRLDSKWNLKFQGLLSSDLLFNVKCDWLDWASLLCVCGDKLASFSPWPESIIEHLNLSNIGRASSNLNQIFRFLLHNCSLLIKRLIKGFSINSRSLLLFLLWNIFHDKLIFGCFDMSGE